MSSHGKWSDPDEITIDNRICGAFTLVLCGVGTWNILSTISFDLSIIARRRPWRWPMLIYFTLRINLLIHLFTWVVKFNTFTKIPCQNIAYLLKMTDAIGTWGSILILVLRTRAVWQHDTKVSLGLGCLFLAQVGFLSRSLTIAWAKSAWDSKRNTCIVISTSPTSFLLASRVYTMTFELIIILLCASRLWYMRRLSSLAHILLRDGIVYFCAVFVANLVQAVMAALALNPVMSVLMMPFASIVSVIASTTVFRNVFVAYDGFDDNSANWPSTRNGPGILRFLSGGPLTTISPQRTKRDLCVTSNDRQSQDIVLVSRGVVNPTFDTAMLTTSKGDDSDGEAGDRPEQFDV